MIKTRLVGLLSHVKKYIVYTILWQWAALLSQVIAVFTIADLLERVVYGAVTETDDFYTGNCCCDPLFLRADGRAVVVSCVCGCEADSARKNL
jgi:ribulose 1,5-bisphosphate synthetase/thiazole synthase